MFFFFVYLLFLRLQLLYSGCNDKKKMFYLGISSLTVANGGCVAAGHHKEGD